MVRFLISLAIIMTLFGCIRSDQEKIIYFPSLEKAIEERWETDVEILMDDSVNKIVIFTDNKQNFTMNNYNKNDEGFQYHSDGETGYQFESNIETLEFIWNTNHMNTSGQKIIWGADYLHDEVDNIKFEFVYPDTDKRDDKYIIELPIKDHVFAGVLPSETETDTLMELHIYFYSNGEEIEKVSLNR
jgi:hypothetical protein